MDFGIIDPAEVVRLKEEVKIRPQKEVEIPGHVILKAAMPKETFMDFLTKARTIAEAMKISWENIPKSEEVK